MSPYVYVLVRKDLDKSYQAVQACHASLEMGAIMEKMNKTLEGTYMVLLGVKDEDELKSAVNDIASQGVSMKPFFEPDIGMQMTAAASIPVYGDKRKIFKNFKVLR